MLCILVINHLDWRWVFRLPVLLMLVGGTVFGIFVRNSPEDDGFAPLPPEPHDIRSAAQSSRERYWQVLRNRPFQLACLSIGCESVARYGLIYWVPMHFLGAAWRENTGGLWITIALPFGMAAGALTAGLLADRWFPENRSRVVIYFLGLATVGALVLAALPVGQALLGMVFLAVTGFLVYGPQATYWALCPELVGRECASTAARAIAGLPECAGPVSWEYHGGYTANALPQGVGSK